MRFRFIEDRRDDYPVTADVRRARGLAGRLLRLALAPGEPATAANRELVGRHQAGPSRQRSAAMAARASMPS